MFKNVQAELVPAVATMLSDSLTGWADSLSVNVENVDPAYRAKVGATDKRNGKDNTITLRQLSREIRKIDAELAQRDIKVQAKSEQARRTDLYAKQFQETENVSYEPETDQLFMNQLKFAAMLVQECGFDPEFFTDDE